MPKKKCTIVVLAAGKGTRLNLDIPKALAPLNGKKLVDYTLKACSHLQSDLDLTIGFVLGHGKEKIQAHFDSLYDEKNIKIATQDVQNGTGHALQCYLDQYPETLDQDEIIVTCVDTPLITSEIYDLLINSNKEYNATAISFMTSSPHGYGRIYSEGSGFKIIEEKDCSEIEKEIKEVNSGLYIFKSSYLKKYIKSLDNKNKSGEFYLTDLFKFEENIQALNYKDEKIFLGINTLEQLELASKILNKSKVKELRNNGVIFKDSDNVYIEDDVDIKKGSVIHPNVFLYGTTKVGEEVSIEPGVIILNSLIEKGALIKAYSYIENAIVGQSSFVGPFARLRPQAELGENTKVGNFVEIKKSVLKKGSKVSHLSYVGDAEIGERANIGCGFITCNYDGEKKHKTIIGDDCFIGSDCQTIAPVKIEADSFVAAGSTITKDMPSGSFAIARSKQVTKEGRAKNFLKKS